MRSSRFFLALGACLLLASAAPGFDTALELTPKPKGDPAVAATVVIYNSRAVSSEDLAWFYAKARGIAADHVVGLDCPVTEEITRQDYDTTIAEPLRKIFSERGWWTLRPGKPVEVSESRVRFIALMRGMPLKIQQVDHYEGDSAVGAPPIIARVNAASVDSELAALGYFTRSISGALRNPYYDSFTTIFTAEIPALLLVCRLDGASDATVRRMIGDAIVTERTGLWGFAYINERGATQRGLAMGDRWLERLTADAMEHGIPCIVQKGPALFSPQYPMRDAALYYGWYSGNVVGPFAESCFRFTRGAVACHIHSFSAATLRDPNAGWVAPLLERGAAATFGNVYEPYLPFTPNLDIFNERLRNGFTFAESAYMSVNVVSWMTTFVGDPLYRPFKLQQQVFGEAPRSDAAWVAFREGALVWFNRGRPAGETALRKAGAALHSEVIFEGLGLLETRAGDAPAALAAFDQAEKFCANSDDALRILIHEVRLLVSADRGKEALALVRRAVVEFPDDPALSVLRSDAGQIAP